MRYILITGASSGIGLELCKRILDLGYSIIAVSRNTENVKKLEHNISQEVITMDYDLSEQNNVAKVFEKCSKYDVTMVINNAGVGIGGYFNDTLIHNQIDLINLNITALTILTKLFLNVFLRKNNGTIVNIGSVGGYVPGPLLSTYYASKAYVNSFTQALSYEVKKLKKKGVRIVLAVPGPIDTKFHEKAGTKTKGAVPVKEYVESLVDKIFNTKKDFIVIGKKDKRAIFAARHLPRKTVMKHIYKLKKNG